MADYPSSVKTFTTKANGAGNTILAAHINDLQDEITALETALLTGGLAHNVFPSGTRTLGSSSAFWDKVFGTALIVGAESTSGVRLDIESGALAVREGDDSAYAPLKALTLEATGNATVGGTLGVTGVATFTAAPVISAGLQFPASQAAAAGANVLDDYEEGTWTPVLGGSGGTSGQTYGGQVGVYVKIGQYVYVSGDLALTAKGTITDNVQIQGLPFTAHASDSGTIGIEFFQNLNSNVVKIGARVIGGSTAATVQFLAAAAASTSTAATANITDTTRIIFGGCYRAAA